MTMMQPSAPGNFVGLQDMAFLVMPYFISAKGGIWLLSTLGRLWLYAQFEWGFHGKVAATKLARRRMGLSATIPLMPRGSHLFCFAKKGNPKKATPTIGLFLRCSEKSGTKKTRFAQTVFRSDRFFPPLLGANQRGHFERMFDRLAMRSARRGM